MSEEKHSSGISIGFFGLLQLALIILKLCKVIDWPWYLVLGFIEIYAAGIILFALLVAVMAIVGRLFK